MEVIAWQDHPRIRGTNEREQSYSIRIAGSSPHTRDKYDFIVDFLPYIGIIPAYAGQMVQFLKKGR